MNSIASSLYPLRNEETQLVWAHVFDRASQAAQSGGFIERRTKSAWEICRLEWILIRNHAAHLRECTSILYRGVDEEYDDETANLKASSSLLFRITREFLTRVKIVFIYSVPCLLKTTAYFIGLTTLVPLGLIFPTLVYTPRHHPTNMLQTLFKNPDLPIPGTSNTLNQVLLKGVLDEEVDIQTAEWVLPTDEKSEANPYVPALDVVTARDLDWQCYTLERVAYNSLYYLGLNTKSMDHITLNNKAERALQELKENKDQQRILVRMVRSLGCAGLSDYGRSIVRALQEGARLYNKDLSSHIENLEKALHKGEEFYRQV